MVRKDDDVIDGIAVPRGVVGLTALGTGDDHRRRRVAGIFDDTSDLIADTEDDEEPLPPAA